MLRLPREHAYCLCSIHIHKHIPRVFCSTSGLHFPIMSVLFLTTKLRLIESEKYYFFLFLFIFRCCCYCRGVHILRLMLRMEGRIGAVSWCTPWFPFPLYLLLFKVYVLSYTYIVVYVVSVEPSLLRPSKS